MSFDAFWQAYPKKEARPVARVAYDRALAGNPKKGLEPATHNEIMAGIEKFRGKDKQYIPQPATYLNQQRWCDEDEKPFAAGMQTQCTARLSEEHEAHYRRDLENHYRREDEKRGFKYDRG